MRRVLTLMIVLAILVMAQSVVAMMPTPTPGRAQVEVLKDVESLASIPTTKAALRSLPPPMSLVLLMTGLSGLAAAGSRSARDRESSSTD
jgi:hypothetical protein